MAEMTILQVRDIDVAVLDVLKSRAESQGLSLSSFVRNLLAQEASLPNPADVMARIASREPIDISSDEVRRLTDEGRRS